jgi:DnaJ-domain-containing protein 1
MSSVLERLWRIIEANRASASESFGSSDFLREFEQWEERLRKKMKVDEDFDSSQTHYHSYHSHSKTKQASTRDEKIAGYYANLELPYGADLEAVKKAYRKLMKQYHPDKFSGDPEKQKTATELTKGAQQSLSRIGKVFAISFNLN